MSFVWISFPLKRPVWRPRNLEILCFLLGEFSSNTACVTPQNSPIDDWMSFPVKRSHKFPRNLPMRVNRYKTIFLKEQISGLKITARCGFIGAATTSTVVFQVNHLILHWPPLKTDTTNSVQFAMALNIGDHMN